MQDRRVAVFAEAAIRASEVMQSARVSRWDEEYEVVWGNISL